MSLMVKGCIFERDWLWNRGVGGGLVALRGKELWDRGRQGCWFEETELWF